MSISGRRSKVRVEVIKGLGQGGAETLLVTRLRATLEMGLESAENVAVISTSSSHDYYAEQLMSLGVRLHELRGGRVASTLGLIRLIVRLRPSSIVCHSPFPALAIKVGKALRVIRSPLIEVTHSTHHHRLLLFLGAFFNRFAEIDVPVSEEVARSKTAQHFGKRVVSHGGVERRQIAEFMASGEAGRLRRESVVAQDSKLAVAVGNLRSVKGHRYIIRAMSLPGLENWELIVCGEGPERAELESLVEELDLGGRVHLLGSVPRAWRYLCAADLQIHYSTHEGLPVALMEGAVVGIRQLVSNISGTREFLSLAEGARSVVPSDPRSLAEAWLEVESVPTPVGSMYWDIERHAMEMSSLIEDVSW